MCLSKLLTGCYIGSISKRGEQTLVQLLPDPGSDNSN